MDSRAPRPRSAWMAMVSALRTALASSLCSWRCAASNSACVCASSTAGAGGAPSGLPSGTLLDVTEAPAARTTESTRLVMACWSTSPRCASRAHAPCFTSASAAAACPPKTAQCNALRPQGSVCPGSAPRTSSLDKSDTQGGPPHRAATCTAQRVPGATRSCSGSKQPSISAQSPSSRSHRAAWGRPSSAAQSTGFTKTAWREASSPVTKALFFGAMPARGQALSVR
mmetsp:Transcript_94745/g.268217  ORF Transcript_94745/g.268217 Transcript_94745/m.268217 type:complete len:227 (-) Transcript_94745:198-878(-)